MNKTSAPVLFLALPLGAMGGMSVENRPSGATSEFLLLGEWGMQEVEDLLTELIDPRAGDGDLERSDPNPSLGREKSSLL